MTNTLAFYDMEIITVVLSFITQGSAPVKSYVTYFFVTDMGQK